MIKSFSFIAFSGLNCLNKNKSQFCFTASEIKSKEISPNKGIYITGNTTKICPYISILYKNLLLMATASLAYDTGMKL